LAWAIGGRRESSVIDNNMGERNMKFRIWLTCSVLALLLQTMAHAQVTIDITKITCREFLIGRILPTSSMALWFSGYYNGKRGATTIDASTVKPNADKVSDYCGLHQDETVMHAVETLFGIK
jgi:acid stress chaperone HdeB